MYIFDRSSAAVLLTMGDIHLSRVNEIVLHAHVEELHLQTCRDVFCNLLFYLLTLCSLHGADNEDAHQNVATKVCKMKLVVPH
jgi:hypothetical protein